MSSNEVWRATMSPFFVLGDWLWSATCNAKGWAANYFSLLADAASMHRRKLVVFCR